MSILGPILMAMVIILPVWLSTIENSDTKRIAIVDKSGQYGEALEDSETLKFDYTDESTDIETLKRNFNEMGYYAVVEIPDLLKDQSKNIVFYSEKQPDLGVKMYISRQIENLVEAQKFKDEGIDKELVESLSVDVSVSTQQLSEDGTFEESSTEISMAVGLFAGLIIYMFIFIYGAQVMRGVIEEKTNRVVELIVSSVKPFQMMMGKIIGVALVALTQFALWIVLTFFILFIVQGMFLSGVEIDADTISAVQGTGTELNVPSDISSGDMTGNLLTAFFNIPIFTLLISFILYFIGGYLLYAALFAAIGSAVDSEADTQQFMLPVTIPLILSMVSAQIVMSNHNGNIAFWMSQIPLTSPVIMLIRIPFGDVPLWEITLSIAILFVTFIGTTWLAARIYRTGILMYGKKISYRELLKWIKY